MIKLPKPLEIISYCFSHSYILILSTKRSVIKALNDDSKLAYPMLNSVRITRLHISNS